MSERAFSPEPRKERRLEDALAESGATIHEAGESDLSADIDHDRLDMFPAPILEAMQKLATSSREYLGNAVVTDLFTDHIERRAWRTKVIQDFGKEDAAILERNRLRQNLMASAFQDASALRRLLPEPGSNLPYVEEMRDILDGMLELAGPFQLFSLRYGTLALPEKLEFVRELSQYLRRYLVLVTRKS